MTLDTEIAQELAWGISGDGYTLVADQFVTKHRWYSKRLIVFTPPLRDGDDPSAHLMGLYYNDPSGEDVMDDKDRFDDHPVPCFRVLAREVTVTTYCDAREAEGPDGT